VSERTNERTTRDSRKIRLLYDPDVRQDRTAQDSPLHQSGSEAQGSRGSKARTRRSGSNLSPGTDWIDFTCLDLSVRALLKLLPRPQAEPEHSQSPTTQTDPPIVVGALSTSRKASSRPHWFLIAHQVIDRPCGKDYCCEPDRVAGSLRRRVLELSHSTGT